MLPEFEECRPAGIRPADKKILFVGLRLGRIAPNLQNVGILFYSFSPSRPQHVTTARSPRGFFRPQSHPSKELWR